MSARSSILAGQDRISLGDGLDLRLLSALEVLQARREAAANGTGGTMVLMPAWEIKEGELVQDGDANITFTSLEEYAKIQPDQTAPEPKPAQEASEAPQAEPAEASEPTNAAEAESTGPETP